STVDLSNIAKPSPASLSSHSRRARRRKRKGDREQEGLPKSRSSLHRGERRRESPRGNSASVRSSTESVWAAECFQQGRCSRQAGMRSETHRAGLLESLPPDWELPRPTWLRNTWCKGGRKTS